VEKLRSRYGEEAEERRIKEECTMADIQLHAMLRSIRGKVGDVVFKKRGDKLYISRRPDFSKRKLSAAQKESIARFRAAVRYAQEVLNDPESRRPFALAAEKNGRTVYNTIIAEHLRRA